MMKNWNMKNVKIWMPKDEPVYDEATDMAYQILSVGEGSTYANGVLTVSFPEADDDNDGCHS